jgi:hypothetical protein
MPVSWSPPGLTRVGWPERAHFSLSNGKGHLRRLPIGMSATVRYEAQESAAKLRGRKTTGLEKAEHVRRSSNRGRKPWRAAARRTRWHALAP